MDESKYYQGGPERIIELLKAEFGNYFKAYMNGLADDIPESLLPCVMVSLDAGDVTAGSTAHDVIDEAIVIVIAINKKDHIGSSGLTNEADLHLRRLVLGIDPSTRQWHQNSIMGVLRTNFTLNEGAVNNDMTYEFAPSQRGDKLYTQEAYITLNRRYQVIVPTRD